MRIFANRKVEPLDTTVDPDGSQYDYCGIGISFFLPDW